jgi:hypothetical protein
MHDSDKADMHCGVHLPISSPHLDPPSTYTTYQYDHTQLSPTRAPAADPPSSCAGRKLRGWHLAQNPNLPLSNLPPLSARNAMGVGLLDPTLDSPETCRRHVSAKICDRRPTHHSPHLYKHIPRHLCAPPENSRLEFCMPWRFAYGTDESLV